MTDQEARQLASAYVQAMGGQSADNVLSLCSEEVEYTGLLVRKITGDPSGTIRGKAAVRKFLQEMMRDFGGSSIGRVGNGVSSIVVEATLAGSIALYVVLIMDQAGKVKQVLMHQQIP